MQRHRNGHRGQQELAQADTMETILNLTIANWMNGTKPNCDFLSWEVRGVGSSYAG